MLNMYRTSGAWIAIGLIGLVVISRLAPHPPNFTATLAVALFCGGAMSRHPLLAMLIPLFGMVASDLILGLHETMWGVYVAIAFCVWVGYAILDLSRVWTVFTSSIIASTLFFMMTNFIVWLQGDLYLLTPAGLLACYIAAIPFFHHTLISTVLFTLALFGLSRLLSGKEALNLLPSRQPHR